MADDPRIIAARGDIAALHLKDLVEADTYVSGDEMRVAVPAAPLTASPDGEAEMTSQLLFGEIFTVYEVKGGWAWGQSALDGYVGYVPDHDLVPGGQPTPTHRVKAMQAIIYPEPNMKSRPIGAIPFGASVAVKGGEGAFAALDPGGFTPAPALAELSGHEALWVTTAERFIGAPYLWGGRSPAGLDCSGLVQIALQASGVACPRDSDQQMAALGREVDIKKAARGDLVFWKGHVGIMTSANKLLHANAHHMAVTEEPFEVARKRIAEGEFGEILAVKRLSL